MRAVGTRVRASATRRALPFRSPRSPPFSLNIHTTAQPWPASVAAPPPLLITRIFLESGLGVVSGWADDERLCFGAVGPDLATAGVPNRLAAGPLATGRSTRGLCVCAGAAYTCSHGPCPRHTRLTWSSVCVFVSFSNHRLGSNKARRRKTTGTGRCRYLKTMPRRFKNGFMSGTQAKKMVPNSK